MNFEWDRFKRRYVDEIWQSGLTGLGFISSRRFQRWNGTLCDPGPFVESFSMSNFKRTYNNKLKRVPEAIYTGLAYDINIKTLFPLELAPTSRLETIATQHLASNELIRIDRTWFDLINARWVRSTETEKYEAYKYIADIAESYIREIQDAQLQYYTDLSTVNSNCGIEQFQHYVTTVKDSRAPKKIFDGYWRDLLKTPYLLPGIKLDIDLFCEGMRDNLPKLNLYDAEHPLYIKNDAIVEALRARQATYTDLSNVDCIIKAHCDKVSDRTAGGVAYLAQERYGLKDRHDVKVKVLSNSWWRIARKIAKNNLFIFGDIGPKSYVDISKMSNPFYADLTSGEMQFLLLRYLKYCADYSGVNMKLGAKGCSGLGLTPEMNLIVVSLYSRYLNEVEGITNDLYTGGDNLVYKNLDDKNWEEICAHWNVDKKPEWKDMMLGLSKSERYLGWKGKSHYPIQLIHDNRDHSRAWHVLKNYSGSRSKIGSKRLLNAVLCYDLQGTGACLSMYEWILKNKELVENIAATQGDMVTTINKYIFENDVLREKFMKEPFVIEALEWIRQKVSPQILTEEDVDNWRWTDELTNEGSEIDYGSDR